MATAKRIRKPMPLKGRRTSWPADGIGPDYSPNALNVRFRFGEARGAPGRGLFDAGPVAQKAVKLDNFSLSTNIIWPILLTDSKLFRRGLGVPGDFDAWFEVMGTFVPIGTRRWSACVGEDRYFFSRGDDEIAQWTGNPVDQFDFVKNVAGFEGIGGSANCVSARFIEYFNNRVVCGFVTENGVIKANRLRWPYDGDFRKWNETLGLGAGFMDLNSEGAEAIRNMRSLYEYLVVYRHHSISHIVATGTLAPVHQEIVVSRGLGIGAPYTLASNGSVHFFLGTDNNVYAWNGTTLAPIGNAVQEELKSLVYNDALNLYFGFCAPTRFEYWLVLCDNIRSSFDVFVYDYLRGYWTRDSFPNLWSLGEIEIPLQVFTWLTIPGIWTDYAMTSWNDLSATSVIGLLGGRTDSATMRIDEQFASDYYSIGSIMDRVLETEDIYIDTPWDLAQIVQIMLVYQLVTNDPFEVAVSFDRGFTWTTKEIVPDPKGYSIVEFDKTGNVIRFRFRENNATGQFRWRSYMYEFLPAGDFIRTSTA